MAVGVPRTPGRPGLGRGGGRAWLREALADNPVGLWVPGVNQSGTSLRSCSPGWAEKVRRSLPVAWWRLGEASGSVAVDEVAARNLTYWGSPVKGVAGGLGDDPSTCVTFDQIDDTAQAAYNVAFNPALFSISTWAYIASGGSGTTRILAASRDAAGSNTGYLLYVNSANALGFRCYKAAGASVEVNQAAVATDAWVHIVGTYDGTNLSLFVNGVSVAGPTALGAAFVPNTTGGFSIGASSGFANYFNGKMQGVVLHDRALSADEIADLYLAGKATHTATLTGGVTTGVAGPHPGGSQAFDYDGVDDYLSVPYARGLNPAAAFTIEAWAKVEGGAGSTRALVDCRGDGTTSGFLLMAAATNVWTSRLTNGSGFSADIFSARAATIDEQIHVAQTYDGTTNTLYVNGSSVGTATGTFVANTAFATTIASASAINLFNGKIGGVAIYRTALSAADVLRHYNAGRR